MAAPFSRHRTTSKFFLVHYTMKWCAHLLNLKALTIFCQEPPCYSIIGQGFWVKNRQKAYVFCTLAQNRCSITVLSSKIALDIGKLWPPPPTPPQKEVIFQFWAIYLISIITSIRIDQKACEWSHLKDIYLKNINHDWYGGWEPHGSPKKGP